MAPVFQAGFFIYTDEAVSWSLSSNHSELDMNHYKFQIHTINLL